MWKKLNSSAVDEVKTCTREPEVKLKGILRNCSKNPTTIICSYRRSPKHPAMQYFDMEEWDELFAAKKLKETNCTPIIPKKYTKQFENGTNSQNLKNNRGSNQSAENNKKNKTLNNRMNQFLAGESDRDLIKWERSKEKLRNTSSTEVQGIAKRSTTNSLTKVTEKNPKSINWIPNIIRHTDSLEEKPIHNRRVQRFQSKEHNFVYNRTFSSSQNKAKLRQKSNMGNDGERLPIQSFIDELTKDPVKFQLPERINRFNSKK